jgi:hypothetical protein
LCQNKRITKSKEWGKWKRSNSLCNEDTQVYALSSLRLFESKEKQWIFVAQPHYKLHKVLSDPCLMTCLVILLGWMFESICCTHIVRIELNTYPWVMLWGFCDNTWLFDCLTRMMRILLRHSNPFMIMLCFFAYFEKWSLIETYFAHV